MILCFGSGTHCQAGKLATSSILHAVPGTVEDRRIPWFTDVSSGTGPSWWGAGEVARVACHLNAAGFL